MLDNQFSLPKQFVYAYSGREDECEPDFVLDIQAGSNWFKIKVSSQGSQDDIQHYPDI